MVPKKASEPISTEKRLSPFNCPSCGSMNEIVKTFKNGKVVLECADCNIDKNAFLGASLPKDLGKYNCQRCGNKDEDILIVKEGDKEVAVYCPKCGETTKIK